MDNRDVLRLMLYSLINKCDAMDDVSVDRLLQILDILLGTGEVEGKLIDYMFLGWFISTHTLT